MPSLAGGQVLPAPIACHRSQVVKCCLLATATAKLEDDLTNLPWAALGYCGPDPSLVSAEEYSRWRRESQEYMASQAGSQVRAADAGPTDGFDDESMKGHGLARRDGLRLQERAGA